MTDQVFITNVLAWSAQAGVVAIAGGIAGAAVRSGPARVRFAYWRLLVGLCVLLPWAQPRALSPNEAAAGITTTIELAQVLPESEARVTGVEWQGAAVALLAAGVALRLGWLALGLLWLRHLRRTSRRALGIEDHDALQRMLGTRADVRYIAGLRQPATFGLRHPVVLLPESLTNSSAEVQRAVLCHELLHVRRSDWAWMLLEELLRAALWFHPGVWWLVSRVQLAREEVVDELVVRTTGRRAYMEALLAFADTPGASGAWERAAIAPVAAFARRRHLFRRIVLISKEAVMSSRQLVLWSLAAAMIVSGATWYVVDAFPLQQPAGPGQISRPIVIASSDAPGPLELRAQPITPENPIPRRTYSVSPAYPAGSVPAGSRGAVSLRLTVDETGRVAEVRALRIPERVTFDATPPGSAGRSSSQPNPIGAGVVDAFVDAAVAAVRQWQYDPPANGPISFQVSFYFEPDGDAALIAHGGPTLPSSGGAAPRASRTAAGVIAPPPPPPPAPPPPAPDGWAAGAVRVGGLIMQPTRTRFVAPIYPAIAQSSKVQGVVIVEARVEPDGRTGDVRILRSIPLLDQAAIDAVRQWEYTPTLLNGVPVPVIMTMTVSFTLS